MKQPWLVFTLSLAVNAALIAAVVARPTLVPAPMREALHLGGAEVAAKTSRAKTAASAPRQAAAPKLWPLLATEDLQALVTRLKAAGFPPDVIREIVRSRINASYGPRLRAYSEPDANTPYWKMAATAFAGNPVRLEAYQQLIRERSKALRDALSDPDLRNTEEASAAQRRQFGNLPREKIDAVQRIEDDYADMMSAIRAGMNGITLPEDRAKVALLAREKRADLAAALSPAELADYELRSSPLTQMLARELNDLRPSEAEFRAIFDLHQAMNERFPYVAGGTMNMGGPDRVAAQRELEAQLQARIGETRFNEYVRETSDDFQQLKRMVQRDHQPVDLAVRAYETRNAVSQESMRIINDASLSAEQQKAALVSLAQNTRNQLLTMLGASGPAYVKLVDDQYLKTVERGIAVTFDGGPNRAMGSGSDNVMVSLGHGMSYHNPPTTRPPAPVRPPTN